MVEDQSANDIQPSKSLSACFARRDRDAFPRRATFVINVRFNRRGLATRSSERESTNSQGLYVGLAFLFQCSCKCAGQEKERPQGDQDDDSKSNQLGQILGLCAVGVAISDKTTDAYSRRCCAFHSITGKGQSFGRKRIHLKVTRLLPSSGKTRTDKSQIVSTKVLLTPRSYLSRFSPKPSRRLP